VEDFYVPSFCTAIWYLWRRTLVQW